MKLGACIACVAVSALAVFGAPLAAFAQSDCKTLVKASPFGPSDEVGATNRVTPAVTKAAAAEIQTGKITPMAYNLIDGVPLFGTLSLSQIRSGRNDGVSAEDRQRQNATDRLDRPRQRRVFGQS